MWAAYLPGGVWAHVLVEVRLMADPRQCRILVLHQVGVLPKGYLSPCPKWVPLVVVEQRVTFATPVLVDSASVTTGLASGW